jgi:hypothetical protein
MSKRIHMSIVLAITALAISPPIGCAAMAKRDLSHDPFPEAQEESHASLAAIVTDVENANVQGLRDSHLDSAKFTKFGGKNFERMSLGPCNEREADGVTSVQDIAFEMKNRRIDVFGDVAVMTCYNHFSFREGGKRRQRIVRNTLVFLKTDKGWKIVHEHVTPNECFGTPVAVRSE